MNETLLIQSAQNRPGGPLTERQRQVHELIRYGMTDKQIARKLGIAHGTVKIHVACLLIRLGAQNRTQAAVMTR